MWTKLIPGTWDLGLCRALSSGMGIAACVLQPRATRLPISAVHRPPANWNLTEYRWVRNRQGVNKEVIIPPPPSSLSGSIFPPSYPVGLWQNAKLGRCAEVRHPRIDYRCAASNLH
ncbi:hypothetical protein SODALDRAFT_326613, partial [Sodiomyces alkalinus F11]